MEMKHNFPCNVFERTTLKKKIENEWMSIWIFLNVEEDFQKISSRVLLKRLHVSIWHIIFSVLLVMKHGMTGIWL